MSQIMNMMSGNAPSYAHTLELRLASKTKAPAAPSANHLIPPGLQMGPSLPLVTPPRAKPVKETYGMPPGYEKPKGRMLIYWGCGEHAARASRRSSTSPRWLRARSRRAWRRWPMSARMADRAAQRAGLWRMAEHQGQPPGPGERIAGRRAQDRGQLFAADRLHAGAGLHARAEPARSGRNAVGRSAARLDSGADGNRICAGDVRRGAERRRDHLDLVKERGDGAGARLSAARAK